MRRRISDLIRQLAGQGTRSDSDPAQTIRLASLFLHPEVTAYFLELLMTLEESAPLLELLDILEVNKINEDELYVAVGNRIRQLIEHAKQPLTQTYAVKAAVNFSDVEGMLFAVAAIMLNPSAPYDARFHGIRFLRRVGKSDLACVVLQQLLSDAELSADAAKLLQIWEKQ